MLWNNSCGSRRQVCLWSNRTAEDASSSLGRTSTVSSTSLFDHDGRFDTFSFYEGHTMDLVTFATRVCKLLGVETMIGMLGRRYSQNEGLTMT